MKQRLISAAIGIPIVVVILLFYNTILLNIAIDVVALFSVFELFVATKYLKNHYLTVICFVFTASIPFFEIHRFRIYAEVLCYIFIITLFVFLMLNHKAFRFEQIGTVFFLTILISFSFSSIVFLRDIFAQKSVTNNLALFYICLIFLGGWITDAGAYFIGRTFGKRKLAPDISPKKTVEGAIGGLVCVLIAFLIAAFSYQVYTSSIGVQVHINYLFLVVDALLCGVAAILGDLSASMIKRECKIKDFGNILPGHGGMLDRFDSIMFVAPLMFILLQVMPLVE